MFVHVHRHLETTLLPPFQHLLFPSRCTLVQPCLVLPQPISLSSWDTFRSFLSAACSLRPHPASQAAHLTIWLPFFQSRCKGPHQRLWTSLIPPTLLLLWPGFYCSYRLHGDVQEGGNNVDHMYMKPSTTHLAAGSWTPSSCF